MFAKKFLSIVSLLLLGSLTRVNADVASLPACTTLGSFNSSSCDANRTHNKYCIDGIKIFSVDSSGLCVEDPSISLSTNTINVVNISTPGTAVNLGDDLTNDIVTNSYIALVGCSSDACVQTFGYVKSNEGTPKYFKISSDGLNADISTAVNGNSCAAPSDSGKLTTTGLCLDGTNTAALDSGDSLAVDGQSVFTGTNTNKIAVNVGANVIGLNKLLETSYEYCVKSDGSILKRNDGYCASVDCDSYYTCANTGICQKENEICSRGETITDGHECDLSSPTTAACPEGYYLQDKSSATALVTTNDGEGNFYHCDDKGSCTSATSKNGYYKNTGNDSSVGVVPYIKCSGSSCKAITISQVVAAADCSSTTDSDGSALTINIGDVITDGTDFFICLATTAAGTIKLDPSVTSGNALSYFISVNGANAFNGGTAKSGKHVAINLFEGHALLQTITTDTVPPRYQYTTTAYKITPKGGDGTMCPAGSPAESEIVEFKVSDCEDGTDRVAYYVKQ